MGAAMQLDSLSAMCAAYIPMLIERGLRAAYRLSYNDDSNDRAGWSRAALKLQEEEWKEHDVWSLLLYSPHSAVCGCLLGSFALFRVAVCAAHTDVLLFCAHTP